MDPARGAKGCGYSSGYLDSGGPRVETGRQGNMGDADFEFREQLNQHAPLILAVWDKDKVPLLIVDATPEQRRKAVELLGLLPDVEVGELARAPLRMPEGTYAWLLEHMEPGDAAKLDRDVPYGRSAQSGPLALVVFSGRMQKGWLREVLRDELERTVARRR